MGVNPTEEENPPMELYIAGPMTGQPSFNFPTFDAAVELLESLDDTSLPPGPFTAVSPAELDDPETRRLALASPDGSPGTGSNAGQTWGDFLARDVKIIADQVDGVALLPGWETSKGARLEAFIARHVGKPVFYINDYLYHAHRDDWPEGTVIDRDKINNDLYSDDPEAWIPSLIELDDAELDTVLTLADLEVLMKIDEDGNGDAEGRRLGLVSRLRRGGQEVAAAPVVPAGSPDGGQYTGLDKPQERSADGEVRVTSDTGGQKGSKPERLDLVPVGPLLDLARVYHMGAEKYDETNYLKGYGYRLSIAALLRHVAAFAGGEELDPESGLPHLAHAAWHCFTLQVFCAEDLGEDNRLYHAYEASRNGEL